MKNVLLELKTDTWAVIGAGALFATILATIMLALHASTNSHIDAQVERLDTRISEQNARLGARIDSLGVRIDAQGASLGARIDAQGASLGARIDAQGARLGARIDAQGARIDMLYDDMRNEHTLILESIAGVGQRVSYIEGHLGINRTADPEAAGPQMND